MEIEGKIRRYAKGGPPDWVVSVPLLDIQTQGRSRKQALKMLLGAIQDYFEYFFGKKVANKADVFIVDEGKSQIGIACSDLSVLMSLVLIKQREVSGVTVREIVQRMGKTSPNAYKQYEYGKKRMSTEKFDELIRAVNPTIRLLVSVA